MSQFSFEGTSCTSTWSGSAWFSSKMVGTVWPSMNVTSRAICTRRSVGNQTRFGILSMYRNIQRTCLPLLLDRAFRFLFFSRIRLRLSYLNTELCNRILEDNLISVHSVHLTPYEAWPYLQEYGFFFQRLHSVEGDKVRSTFLLYLIT